MKHGNICIRPKEDIFGYFAWPSIARMDDGTLVVGASGLRHRHVCPWGKTTLFYSYDNGETWTEPVVIHDSPLDDRDVGVVNLGGNDILVTWFTSDPRQYEATFEKEFAPDVKERMRARLSTLDDDLKKKYVGSWTRISHDGGKTWSKPRSCPVNSPHGPIVLRDGTLFYLGKQFPVNGVYPNGDIQAAISRDQGETWELLGCCPLPEGFGTGNVHEPHVCQMSDGRLVGHIRVEGNGSGISIWQSESTDNGMTWTKPFRVPVDGTPPHLLHHSSGALICVYGYRMAPDGQRAVISTDEGRTWTHHVVLRDDGPNGDLGYPATVEMPDGSLFTIYYQAAKLGDPVGIMYTHWELPDELK